MEKLKAQIIILKYIIMINIIKIVFCNKITLKIERIGNLSVLGYHEKAYFERKIFQIKLLSMVSNKIL